MKRLLTVSTLVLLICVPAHSADEHHPHHVGVTGGIAGHDSKASGFIGLEYSYRFKNDWAALVFTEQVRGDFDVDLFGIGAIKHFANGFKIAAGPGVERKIKKNKTLFLIHVGVGYDWHSGSWSYGPVVAIDFIEDSNQVYYAGFGFGYGF